MHEFGDTELIRILIADDHAMMRRGVVQLLKESFRSAHFGEAASGLETLKAVAREKWNLLILDLGLPGRSGLEVLRELKGVRGSPPVIVYTMYPEEQYAFRAIKAGAAAYLTKAAKPEELTCAVRTVLHGSRYINGTVADLLAFYVDEGHPLQPHDQLSDREFTVLRMLASGKTVKQTANELSLSDKTVSTYRARILEKTGMRNTAELIRYALDHKLLGN